MSCEHTVYDCKECAAQERHEAILNVLLEISQSLSALLLERRSDTSLTSVVDKLDSIRYSLNNR